MLKKVQKIASIVLFSFIIANLVPLNTFAFEVGNHQSKIIVSLGDSYSSGEGITPFLGEYSSIKEMEARGNQGLVEFQDWLAHRSQNAWSGMLTLPGVSGTMTNHRNENWFFVASSGAVIDDLYGTQWKTYSKGLDHGAIQQDYQKSYRQFLAPQLNIFAELRKNDLYADYVTITIGGNDLGFSEMVTQCVASNDCTELQRMIAGAKERFGLKDDDNPELIRNKLKKAYKDILTEAGEQAHIIVVGYPILFDANGGDVLIDVAKYFDSVFFRITPEEAGIIKDAALWFDTELKAVVEECGLENIHYVSVVEAFLNHPAYSENAFLNEVMLVQSEDLVDFISKPNETIIGWPPKTQYERPSLSDVVDPVANTIASAFSIHPNLQGAQVYASCVQAQINELEMTKIDGQPAHQSGINEDTMVSIYVASGNKVVTKDKNGTSIKLKFYGFMADGKPLWVLSDIYFPATSDINYPSNECTKDYYVYDYYAAKEISKIFTQHSGYESIDPQVDEIEYNTLRSYGISEDDILNSEVYARFIGVNASGGVEIEHFGATFGCLRTFDNNNCLILDERYHAGDLITSIRYQYGNNGILEASKTHSSLGNITIDTEYSKDSDDKTDLLKSYQYEGGQRPNNCQPETSRVYYDNNGLRERSVSNYSTTEYYYQFTQVTIPPSQVEYITSIYESLDIPYIIVSNSTNVANTF